MLETDRIYLRSIKISDAQVLFEWGNNPLYHETAGFEHYSNLISAQKAAQAYHRRPYSYAIILKENQKMIGLVELYDRGMDKRAGLLKTKDLGFMLDHRYWHHGYMTEALSLIFNYAFNELKQNQIWAGTFSNNQNSQRLLRALGFRYVFTTDYSKLFRSINYKEKYFLLTPQDWYDTMHVNTKS